MGTVYPITSPKAEEMIKTTKYFNRKNSTNEEKESGKGRHLNKSDVLSTIMGIRIILTIM